MILKLLRVLAVVVLALSATLAVLATGEEMKGYPEGDAGLVSEPAAGPSGPELRGVEGMVGPSVALDSKTERPWPEGEAGKTGQVAPDGRSLLSPQALSVRLQFSGVTDDGQKGSASRREATSILCTNTGTVNATIYVEIYQWSGTLVYTGTVNAPPRSSYTFSTQNTTIYFDDVILGPGGGTGAIFQGSGQVLSDRTHVICTAEVLDPLNYPPTFIGSLEMVQP